MNNILCHDYSTEFTPIVNGVSARQYVQYEQLLFRLCDLDIYFT